MVTPAGVVETRRLPGSGAGPSPDRLFIGSEGILGVDHRGLDAPPGASRASAPPPASPSPTSPAAPTPCARSRSRASIPPTAACSTRARPLTAAPVRATAPCCSSRSSPPTIRSTPGWHARSNAPRDHGGAGAARRRAPRAAARRASATAPPAPGGAPSSTRPTCATRSSRMGMISETFETAVTWDRFAGFHAGVVARHRGRASAASAAAGQVTCRFTHVYPDGPAPYYTVLAPARPGGSSSSGPRSRRRRPRRSSASAARSRTTTPSVATTGPGTTASGPTGSPRRCARPSARSTRPASSIPAC